jgi:hypothetical protein
MWIINSCRGVKLADQPYGHVIYMMTSSILLYYLYCTPSSKGYNFYIIGSAIIVDSRGRDFMLYFTLSDGLYLPRRTHICMAAGLISRDPEVVGDTETT